MIDKHHNCLEQPITYFEWGVANYWKHIHTLCFPYIRFNTKSRKDEKQFSFSKFLNQQFIHCQSVNLTPWAGNMLELEKQRKWQSTILVGGNTWKAPKQTDVKIKSYTSTRAASFLGKDPTIEGETPTSFAPATIADSVHPNLTCSIKSHNMRIHMSNRGKIQY